MTDAKWWTDKLYGDLMFAAPEMWRFCIQRRFEEVLAQNEGIDAAHLQHQKEWSEATFGPGQRTEGVVAHIRKELDEIEAEPWDLFEWVDILILAFDGAWRAGWEPQEILDAIVSKQKINEARDWPDWRLFTEGQAIEHIKE